MIARMLLRGGLLTLALTAAMATANGICRITESDRGRRDPQAMFSAPPAPVNLRSRRLRGSMLSKRVWRPPSRRSKSCDRRSQVCTIR
jgi:hypothetical protein